MKPKGILNHPEPVMQQMVKLYESGMSLAKIGGQFNRTRQAVWEALKARGVQMRSRIRHGHDNHFWLGGNNALRKQRRFAQHRAQEAIAKGRLQRKPCEKCGAPAHTSQAHHDDYTKPLEVRWLCQVCHHAVHYSKAS